MRGQAVAILICRLVICLLWLIRFDLYAFRLKKPDELIRPEAIADKRLDLAESFRVDEARFKKNLAFFASEPHPHGSPRQKVIAQFLKEQAQESGATFVVDQSFQSTVPLDPPVGDKLFTEIETRNIFAGVSAAKADAGCVVILGSHYDTKSHPKGYLGANDSGSSSILLLELIRFFSSNPPTCHLGFIWFDGEESVLEGWEDSLNKLPWKKNPRRDHLYGSRYFVEKLVACEQDFCLPAQLHPKSLSLSSAPIRRFILADLVGGKPLKLSWDENSSLELRQAAKAAAAKMGFADLFATRARYIDDDHTPFRERGIQAIDLIDFENLSTWHQLSDTVDKVHASSAEIVGKLMVYLTQP